MPTTDLATIVNKAVSENWPSLALVSPTVGNWYIDEYLPEEANAGRVWRVPSIDGFNPLIPSLSFLNSLSVVAHTIGDNGATAIAEHLTNLTNLNLWDNRIGESGATAIAEHLTNLTTLNLNDNRIGEGGATAIATNLTNLTTLNLWNNRIGDNSATAIAARLTNLTTLNLNGNEIGESGATAIAARLTNLTNLNLDGNRIGDNGATAIAERLTNLTNLNLYNNEISDNGATAIAERLTNLTNLNLRYNRIGDNGAIAIAAHLTNLTTLNLNGNEIGDNGATAIAERLTNLTTLDLNNNQIGVTGATVIAERLTNLTTLNLNGNRIGESGATAVAECLTNLATLHLGYNKIGDNGATAIAEHLTNLTTLNLNNNKIGDNGATAIAAHLTNLTTLNLNNNKIGDNGATAIAEHLANLANLHLGNNGLSSNFESALEAGIQALREVAKVGDDDLAPLWEAKVLLIGEGEVGKSSLLGALRGDPWDEDRDTTHGLEVVPLKLRHSDVDLELNAWDFAGQEHYRPTHQIFFTAPAIYLVVWKPRVGEDTSRVDEWLHTVRLRTPVTPICIVVATHGGPKAHAPVINQHDLGTKYDEEVIDFVEVDSKPLADDQPGKGIVDLRRLIAETAARLPEMGEPYPRIWTKLRLDLTPNAKTETHGGVDRPKPYLTYREFERIAVDRYGLEEAAAKAVCQIAVVRGQWIVTGDRKDIQADDLVITQPEWLAKAISFMIDDPQTRQANGLILESELDRVWNNPTRDRQYSNRLYPIFLKLMKRFEIAYRVKQTDPDEDRDGPRWLMAQLVSEQPDLDVLKANRPGPDAKVVGRVVRFNDRKNGDPVDSPTGLLFHLIVRLHRFSLGAEDYRDALHWREGAIFHHPSYGRVELGIDNKRLRLKAWGEQPSRMITLIVNEVEGCIADFWPGVVIREWVVCDRTCGLGTPGTAEFDVLKVNEAVKRRAEMQCLTDGCDSWFDPVSLLATYGPISDVANAPILEEIYELRGEVRRQGEEIRIDVNATKKALREGQWGLASQIDHRHDELLATINNANQERPWLILPTPVNPHMLKRSWTKANIQLDLICEHCGRSVADLAANGEPGRYTIPVYRPYLSYLGPWVSFLTKLLTGLSIGIESGIKGEIIPNLEANLEYDPIAALDAFKGLADAVIDEHETIDLTVAERQGIPLPTAAPTEDLAIKMLQDLVEAEDKAFAGMVKRRRNNQAIWVAPECRNSYPQFATNQPGTATLNK